MADFFPPAVEIKRILSYHTGMKKQKLPTTDMIEKTIEDENVNYDTAWKDVIEDLFKLFLEYFYPAIAQEIDFRIKPVYLSQELRRIIKDNQIGKRYADVLVKVQLKDGAIGCLFIHIEVQGSPDKTLPLRMYVYNYRIFDHYNEEVISLAMLTDDDPGFRPDQYNFHRGGFSHTMTYPIVKMLDYQDRLAELEKSKHPMAMVVVAQLKSLEARQADPQTKYNVKLQLFKDCFRKGYNKKQILALIRFIDWIINLPEKYKEKLHNELLTLKEGKTMAYVTSFQKIGEKIGEKKGIAKGSQKTALENARKMLMDNLPIEAIIKYSGLAKGQVTRLMKESALPQK